MQPTAQSLHTTLSCQRAGQVLLEGTRSTLDKLPPSTRPRTSLELFLQRPQRSLQTASLSRREVSSAFQTKVGVCAGTTD